MLSMIFKYNELGSFFDKLKEKGKTSTFKEWNGDNVFIIRHDVDLDVKLAHNLAQIEAKKDIRSTFFFLVTSDFYNILSAENTRLVREIAQMGHEIGLHFDPTLYSDEALNDAVIFETKILSTITRQEIKSISLHNPSLHGKFPLFEGFINAYDPKLFSNENYISDSSKNFRGKNPFDFLERIEKSMVQVLLHPMHYSQDGDNYEGVVCKSILSHANRIHNVFLENKTYIQDVKGSIEDSLKKFL